MNKQQKEKVKEMIEMGKWNYVFTYGIARWGAIMFFFSILWYKFILEYEIDNFIIILNFVIWSISGLFFGLWTWVSINKKLNEK